MRTGTFILKIYSLIGLHRGEEQRVLAFLGLQFAISVIIGLLSTGIDPLFLKHSLDRHEEYFVRIIEDTFDTQKSGDNEGAKVSQLSAALITLSAFLMVLAGLWYAGFTDRIDKRKIGLTGIAAFTFICLAFGMGIMADHGGTEIPFLYSLLYIFRFLAGIYLLITFWDSVNMFFDSRESRRLFPLVAAGGALGYSTGCLLVIPIELTLPSQWVLFIAALLGGLVFLTFLGLKSRFLIVSEPRYRNVSGFREIREGFRQAAKNPFLRALGISTLVFGLLSGLVMFQYNSIVSELRSQNTTVSVIAVQRAVFTLIQAFIVTRLMSMTGMGKKALKEGIILQSVVLLLGFLVYVINIISMFSVADFTRQVEIALMSPAFMSALMVIPIRYRGRSMAFNNLIIAPLGIAITSLAIYFLRKFIPLGYFVYPLILLVFIRLGLNFFVNKQYLKYIKASFASKRRLPLENILEQDLFQNRELITNLMNSASSEDYSLKALIWGKLAEKVTEKADFEYLNTWKPKPDDVMYASWLYTAGRIDYEQHKKIIAESRNSEIREIRLAASEIMTRNDEKILEQTREISADYISSTNGQVPDQLEVLFRIRDGKFFDRLYDVWPEIDEEKKSNLKQLIIKYPGSISARFYDRIYNDINQETQLIKMYPGLPEVTAAEIAGRYKELENTPNRIDYIKAAAGRNDENCDQWLNSLLSEKLTALITSGQYSWNQSMQRQLCWAGEENRVIISLCSILLEKGTAKTPSFFKLAEKAHKEVIKTISCLYQAWYDCSTKKESRYNRLLTKWFISDMNELLQMLLLIAAIPLKTAENRLAIRSIAAGIGGETIMSIKRHHDEIITLLDSSVRSVFLALTETISQDEKLVILKRFTRGFYISFNELMIVFSEKAEECSNQVKKELIRFYIG